MPREILELIIGKLPYAEVAKARRVSDQIHFCFSAVCRFVHICVQNAICNAIKFF